MTCYARVTYQTDASAAEQHDDECTARRWIESELEANPELFRLGQILASTPSDHQIVATYDANGWALIAPRQPAAFEPLARGLQLMTFVLTAFAFVGAAFVAVWCDRPPK